MAAVGSLTLELLRVTELQLTGSFFVFLHVFFFLPRGNHNLYLGILQHSDLKGIETSLCLFVWLGFFVFFFVVIKTNSLEKVLQTS